MLFIVQKYMPYPHHLDFQHYITTYFERRVELAQKVNWDQIVQHYGALVKAGVDRPSWLSYVNYFLESKELIMPTEEIDKHGRQDSDKSIDQLTDMIQSVNITSSPLFLSPHGFEKCGPFPRTEPTFFSICLSLH